MRISEVLQLRVKDLDFDHGTIIVREGKGSKDRALMLPESLVPGLREQLARARAWWLKDQAEGRSGVALPDALERKYPRAGHSWPWFWVFAQHTHSTDPRSGVCVAIICMTRPFSAPSNVPWKKQVSRSLLHRIPCATHSQRPCSVAVWSSPLYSPAVCLIPTPTRPALRQPYAARKPCPAACHIAANAVTSGHPVSGLAICRAIHKAIQINEPPFRLDPPAARQAGAKRAPTR